MAPTQAALYEELTGDLQLSWTEAELPEREPPGVSRKR
ncbi:MAG: hypothetical protein HW413_2450 [Thermoleophilia bacterium]|jgi:hypothetical protein|nr:hypothetical protein [Thermoleophilia bacterium]